MNKRMAISMAASMTCFFLLMGLAAGAPEHARRADIYALLAMLSVCMLFGSTVGVIVFNPFLSLYVRHTGTPATDAVIHARPVGYVNHWPNWELEPQLADGRIAKMEAVRLGGFEPGELLHVVVGRGNPARATYPAEATKRRSF